MLGKEESMDERQEKTKMSQDQQTVTTTSRVVELTLERRYIIQRNFLIFWILFRHQNLYDLMG